MVKCLHCTTVATSKNIFLYTSKQKWMTHLPNIPPPCPRKRHFCLAQVTGKKESGIVAHRSMKWQTVFTACSIIWGQTESRNRKKWLSVSKSDKHLFYLFILLGFFVVVFSLGNGLLILQLTTRCQAVIVFCISGTHDSPTRSLQGCQPPLPYGIIPFSEPSFPIELIRATLCLVYLEKKYISAMRQCRCDCSCPSFYVRLWSNQLTISILKLFVTYQSKVLSEYPRFPLQGASFNVWHCDVPVKSAGKEKQNYCVSLTYVFLLIRI